MNTHITSDKIWASISKELPGEEIVMIREHLDHCASCSSKYEVFLLLHNDLSLLQLEKPAIDLTNSVMKQIHTEQKIKNPTEFWINWTKRLIMGSLIITITLLLVLSSGEYAPSPNDLIPIKQFTLAVVAFCLFAWIFYANDRIIDHLGKRTMAK